MIIIDAIGWWYGWGWHHILDVLKRRLTRLYNVLSVRQMLRTLFRPWKEDRVTGAKGLSEVFQALLMNLVARLIGASVRLMILLFWAVISIVFITVGIVSFILWPILPIVSLGLIWLGIVS